MKERPILFSAPMVRAILEGRKTQTRRVCQYQNFRIEDNIKHPQWGPDLRMLMADSKDGTKVIVGNPDDTPEHALSIIRCPHGKPGDRLWVRETHAYVFRGSSQPGPFSGREKGVSCETSDDDSFHVEYAASCKDWDWEGGWRPSIHMPRWASRLTLEITGVRVERLQCISEEDAKAEGVKIYEGLARGVVVNSEIASFANLWDSLADEKTNWAANPWVWVIEFKKLDPAQIRASDILCGRELL